MGKKLRPYVCPPLHASLLNELKVGNPQPSQKKERSDHRASTKFYFSFFRQWALAYIINKYPLPYHPERNTHTRTHREAYTRTACIIFSAPCESLPNSRK